MRLGGELVVLPPSMKMPEGLQLSVRITLLTICVFEITSPAALSPATARKAEASRLIADPRAPEVTLLSTSVRLIGSVRCARVAEDAAGELCTRSYSIMLGYWNDPEQTAGAIATGWMHTGDLATATAPGAQVYEPGTRVETA
jgi:acyl-CoA synthetase (AMP-forming)/AMP-acid ligase II